MPSAVASRELRQRRPVPVTQARRELRPDRQDYLPARVSGLAELVCWLNLGDWDDLRDLHAHVAGRDLLGDPSKLLRARAHDEQLRAHAARSRRLLRWSAGDGDEDASLTQGGQERLRRLPADRVERDVDATHRLGDILLRVVDVLLGA